MKHSESIANITKALIAVQGELKPIVKDSTNPHFKNKYANLDSILREVLPVLNKHGIALIQGGAENERGVAVVTSLCHTSGEWIQGEYVLPLEKGTAQSAGSAIAYGRRYGLASILALQMEDDDAEGAVKITRLQEEYSQTGTKPEPRAVTSGVAPSCPKCHSDMWDNRLTKKNPKAPDWKCKDKECDGVVWPPKGGPQAQTQQTTENLRGLQTAPVAPDDDELPF